VNLEDQKQSSQPGESMLNERNKYQQGHVVTIIVLVYFLLCDIYNRKIADQNKEGSCNPQNEHGPEKNDLKAGIQREREIESIPSLLKPRNCYLHCYNT
jgi:hypothetical protein